MIPKIIARAALGLAALGGCWAATPGKPTDALMEAYREIGLAKECNHGPPRCISCDYHTQQLAIDEYCHDTPRCTQVRECLRKHIEYVYGQGCPHTGPRCADAIGHYDELRREQGLKPIGKSLR